MPTVTLIGPELFPIPPIRGGATELFIDRLAYHLKKYHPILIGPADPELPAQEARGQVEYRRMGLSPIEKWLYSRYRHLLPLYDRRVAMVVHSLGLDLLHVHNRPLLALFLKKRFPRMPIILHMHNVYSILGKRERPAPGTSIPVEAFLACSRFVLAQERNRLGQGAAAHEVIYNGVDVTAFAPRWERIVEARALREQYGLGEEPVVLFAGKIRESKGVGLLLTAMAHVWEKMPQAVLVLVGGTEFGRGRTDRETPFFKQFREEASRALGRVILTGFLPPDHMPRAYLLGNIFVAPSQNEEALGMVLLEAAACGLPLIGTRQGGIPEVVQDGVNGFLLNNLNDPEELAQKILTLLENPDLRQRLGHQGREQVCQNFSWEHIARAQEGVYDEILERTFGRGGQGPRAPALSPKPPPPTP